MKTLTRLILATGMVLALTLAGCAPGATGTIALSVTDAPIVDTDEVTGVYITFTGYSYQVAEDGESWTTVELDEPVLLDVLSLTGGLSADLDELSFPAGEYEHLTIRFLLGAVEEGEVADTTGSWVNFDDNTTYDEGTDKPLFVPSGDSRGYQAQTASPFSVPANGTVNMVADFDLRKAVVLTGSGDYILKPVVRLIVEDQAGSITGDVTNNTGNDLVVYAYEAGTFAATEDDDPVAEGARFPNAVVSFAVEDTDEDGTLDYTLAFLAAGTYDLVIAQYDPTSGEYVAGSGDAVADEDVIVQADEITPNDMTVE